jgi:hypothetical protein
MHTATEDQRTTKCAESFVEQSLARPERSSLANAVLPWKLMSKPVATIGELPALTFEGKLSLSE